MLNTKKGFTLAEVLITLGIIGVVAAMTIPALMNSTKENEYQVALKKTMSTLSNGLQTLVAKNGGSVNVGTVGSNAQTFRDDFCTVLNCTKGTSTDIWTDTIWYKYYKAGNDTYFGAGEDNSAALNDGALLYFVAWNSCNVAGINMCGYIHVDINGRKPPNMWGKDLYRLYVTLNNGTYSILPAGADIDTWYPADSYCTIGDGRGCAAVRLYNPDKMP